MSVENTQAAIAAAALPEGFVCSVEDQKWGQFAVKIARKGAPLARWSASMVLAGDEDQIPANAQRIRDCFEQWMRTERAPCPAGGWWQD